MKTIDVITEYEKKFNGFLIGGYSIENDFIKDMNNQLSTNEGIEELIQYYKDDLKSRNDTNSTEEQRKELKSIILGLEGLQLWNNKYDINSGILIS